MKKITARYCMPLKWVFPFLIIVCIVSSSIAQTDIPEFQKRFVPLFDAGVNISLLEHYWSTADVILQAGNGKNLTTAYKLGFKTVRLPMDFTLFLKNDKVTFTEEVKKKISLAFDYINVHHMTMILSFHEFGESASNRITNERIMADAEKGIKIWAQIINLFKGKGYDNLYFELYDEPRAKFDETWEMVNKMAMARLRPLDRQRYWIVGTNRYMSVRGFQGLNPIPGDDKVLYSFHFYNPYIFTHQGAPWDKTNTYLTGLPYPYAANEMPPITEKARNDKDMSYNYQHYSEKANKAYIHQMFMMAHEWSMRNNVPIICTETGTIATIPDKYRNNFIRDVADVLKSYGIPMVVWEMDQSFKITDKNGNLLSAITDWINSYKEPKSTELKIKPFGVN